MKIQSHTILDMEAIYFHFQHLENKKKKTGESDIFKHLHFACVFMPMNEPEKMKFLIGFVS